MNMLKVGDKVPDFSAKDQDGNTINLSDYKGKKLVVFFYPKANTPGCTAEACNLRDNYKELQAQGYELLGVSADSEKKQSNFKEKYDFPFPLLADEDHTVINAFGVWGPKKFMGKEYDGIHRTTFIVDGNGVVENVIEKVKTKDHAAQILA
ncbi:MAG: thioredoxin-dependent thiol peroxidase [Allomuricauda sp.]|jgi:peroxiredoxin Q/BCP|uniref:thioredoxin-dependent peroxiredoxin n=1 Tax=Flagellimonas sp. MMG031 TaxID=3158549 RepID=A0AAU7MXF5_9FLAO|nr:MULTISPECIES: thioredoxin-dependent thiol peroxidase [unclassified Allomuricauda]MBO6533399.1 thioredoxin-dependent thiol peroxidase [Allomuricauda sp.]MBO6590109.1 thioredoxin-dependent thiol peroxidase [Allomuricauda sp.]MBO6619743.1 thioredoxin-dependent thiol peroxidase [Allomuricauda sp.]MBO6645630.1 thioredoxin-dependent thiol peroxidase [Allomuricauda sp.]MBO6748081.1 thioredoxin-dependent thiol peroxidase [Allomuricauda sp.]